MNVKQWGSQIIIILLIASLSIVAFKNIKLLSDNILFNGNTQVPKIELIGSIKDKVSTINQNAARHAFKQIEVDKNTIENLTVSDIEKVRKQIKELEKLTKSAESKNLLDKFSQNFDKYANALPSFFEVSKTNDFKKIESKMGLLTVLNTSTIVTLDKLATDINKESDAILHKSEQDSSNSLYQILVVSIITLLFSIVIAFFITRLIGRSVNKVLTNVDTTTQSVTMIKNSIDQTAFSARELEESMNKANESVSELVASIQQVAGNTNETASSMDEISAAIEEMSASINLVAGSAEQLASSAEESSSAIQEMMASIEQVASTASNVNQKENYSQQELKK